MHETRRNLLPGVLLVAILYSGAAIAATVEVGTCKNGFVQFPTIQAAVTSAPEGATVLVCPGIYPEQVTINKTLTLQGVALSTASGATIAAPSGGVLAITNSLATGDPIAAQVLVQNARDVDINNLTVDGSKNGILGCSPTFVGIFYQNASGTISHAAVLKQALSDGLTGCQSGLAIFAQSGSGGYSNLHVENSTVNAYQKNGITGNEVGTSVTVRDNTVIGQGPTTGAAENGIQVGFGATGQVMRNVAIDDVWAPDTINAPGNAASGILVFASSHVTVHNNRVGNTQFGIAVVSDEEAGSAHGNSIAWNKISANHIFDGIEVCSNNNSIHDNTINRSDESGIHLDSVCTNPDGSGTGKGNKIKDNVINSACTGILVGTLTSVAANSIADNDFFNVGSTILNADGCPAPMAAAQATVRSNAVSGAGQGVRLASPVRP